MTVRFAAARRGGNSVLARHLRPLDPPPAANSDAAAGVGIAQMRAALEHFAVHGLAAAERAASAAEQAHAIGDLIERDRWEAILAVLDRRLAARTGGRRKD